MNPRTPKDVIAVTPGGAITLKHIMGFYALFTVPDRLIPANKLAKAWAAEALPMELVPKNRKSVDTFKNACRSVETRRQDSQRETEIKVDRVIENDAECVYQITRMVRDRTNKEIEHPKAMRVTLFKANDDLFFERLETGHEEEMTALADAIREFFDKNGSKVPGSKVRSAIRGVMDRSNATLIRKGVYFVPKEHKRKLDGISEVLDHLYGDDSLTHLIPCANADGEKAVIERHMTEQVQREADELMTELASRLQEGGKIRKDRLGNLIAKRQKLAAHRKAYEALLGKQLDVIGSKFSLVDDQLDKLTAAMGERAAA